jgi:hypothetical protein
VAKENRRSPRGQVSATVVLLADGRQLGSFRVLNLSGGGALLVGRAPAQRPAHLGVLVRLSTGRTVRAEALVVREETSNESSVFAIEFAELSPEDRTAIDNVVLTAVEDEREPTVLVVAGGAEGRPLRRQLGAIGQPSFAVSTREDAVRFLEAPNAVAVAIVDLGLGADAPAVLSYLADQHPKIRRVVITEGAATKPGTGQGEGLAHATVTSPWTRDSLARAISH